MKHRRTFGVAVAGFVLTVAAFMFAQYPQPLSEQFRVHFNNPVVVGKKTLPPGSYRFQRVQASQNPVVFKVYKADGNLMFQTLASKTVDETRVHPGTPDHSEFTLLEVNGKDYLSKLWIGGAGQGWDFLTGTEMGKKAGKEVTVEVNNGSQSSQPNSMANPQ